MKTRDAARGKWPEILTHFGMDPRYLRDVHGPCPICEDGGGKDRYRFDDKEGDGTFYCNQCGPGSGMKLLMDLKGWTFDIACRELDKILGNIQAEVRKVEQSEEDKAEAIRRLLRSAAPLRPGTPAWLYLEQRCGGLDGLVLADLRAHPACRHSQEGGTHPALLAILRYSDNSGASVHRTYLTPDGRKAPVEPVRKIMPGKPLAGSCVRLGPIQDHIGIAEGIETAICASKIFGLPVWSAISANGMQTWVPPVGITAVTVFGDNDANYTGQHAAFELAHRLMGLGLAVDVRIPDIPGTDWADRNTAVVA